MPTIAKAAGVVARARERCTHVPAHKQITDRLTILAGPGRNGTQGREDAATVGGGGNIDY